ncbi:MAG: hypothetical protein V4601_12070 [Pseudomonadota bacterium]
MRSRFFAAGLGCLLLLAPSVQGPAAAQGSLEYAVKSAYLTRFIPFIRRRHNLRGKFRRTLRSS